MCAFCFIISSIPTVKLEIIVDKSKKPHNHAAFNYGVDSRTRTDDLQNHNLTR